jgi:hypothetical protein
MGAPSVSSLSPEEERRSRYYLYTITSAAAGWQVHLDERVFSLEQYCFVEGRQQDFFYPAGPG